MMMAVSSISHYHHHHHRKDDTGFVHLKMMKSIRGGAGVACASSGFEKQHEQRQKKQKKTVTLNRKEKQALLPDNVLIDYVSELDVKFLFDEISTDDLYLIQGAEQPLTGGEEAVTVIVDVGANIGLFALEALKKKSQNNRKCILYAFEPSPETYKALKRNLERKFKDDPNVSLRLANEAVGDGEEDSISFTSFPNAAGWSTAIEDEKETLANVVEYAVALIIKHAPTFLMLKTFARFVLEKNLFFVKSAFIKSICFFVVKWLSRGKRIETVPCVTLSNAIFKDETNENNNDKKKKKINLLKIDVERYELSVLRGILEEDFAHIETIVVEVHDKEDKTGVQDVVALLKSRGKFPRVIVEQPEHLKGSMLFNVFAFR
jgi:FkbM family methyltransferase